MREGSIRTANSQSSYNLLFHSNNLGAAGDFYHCLKPVSGLIVESYEEPREAL